MGSRNWPRWAALMAAVCCVTAAAFDLNPKLRDLVDTCKDAERGDLHGSGYCTGYLNGAKQTHVLVRTKGICFPERTTNAVLQNALLTFAKKHPNDLDMSMAEGVEAAFREAFPCKRK